MEYQSEPVRTPTPLVSIIVVPRQQFGILEECIQTLYANTEAPFETIVVHLTENGRYQAPDLDYPALTLIESDDLLLPHESKNLALSRSNPESKWVVFLDNDVKVHSGWLQALIGAAQAHEAAVAHPLYLIERAGQTTIHMAHGSFRRDRGEGRNLPVMGLGNRPLAEAHGLQDQPSDFVEFHCWMIARSVLEKLGPFEPISIGEHIHHSLMLAAIGEKIVFAANSVITYNADVDDTPGSKRYLRHRWSHRAARQSIKTLKARWPGFSRHWQSKYLAAWEFRSSIEPWYPLASKVLALAGKMRRRMSQPQKSASS